MPKLIIQDQLLIKQPKVIPIETGVTVINALKAHFEGVNPQTAKLHLNDKKLLPTDEVVLYSPLREGDSLTVTHEVKGTVGKILGDFIDPLLKIADDLVGDAFNSLVDIPEFDTQQSSPNNTLSGQKNIVRAYSQKPVVCGSPIPFPDLIGESIEYYDNNIKYSESYFFIAHAVFSGGNVQAGDTLINRFAGASATRYFPVSGITTIPDYRVGNQVREAAGQTLKGTNEGSQGASYTGSQFGTTSTTYAGTTFTIYVEKDANTDSLKTSFDAGNIDFEVAYTATLTDGEGFDVPTSTSGTGVITGFVLEQSDTVYKITVSNFNGPKSNDNNYYSTFIFTELLDNTLGPFVNPAQCEKMFFNIRFDRGLKGDVPLQVVVYELDALGGTRTGTSETFNVTYTEDTLTEVLRTFEINIANGVAWYEWTIQRTNQSSEDTQEPDIAKLEKAYCIQELGDYDFANATMLKSIMTAEQTAGSGTVDNKINIVGGTTEMPSYDVNAGTITADAPSRLAADALLFVWRDFYNLDTNLLNLDELYTISNSLPEALKTFDYTFDNASTGVGDVVDIILDVMRVQRYWDGKQIRFWRDEATSINSAILSRTDMASESERTYSLTRSCFVTGQYDSVQIEYVDRSINKKAYIYRSVDSGGNIVNVPGQNPLSKTLTGCQSEDNAINRAELEIRKILYQRWSLSDTFIDSHRFLEKGAVVLYNEVYEGGDAWGGEIVNVVGNTATVRENLSLVGGTSYQVFYTNEFGDVVGPQTITASTSNSFTCADLSEVYLSGFEGAQLGSRYYITEVNDSVKRRYRVIERTSSDYNVQLSMIGYDERIYEYDTM